MLLQTDIVLRSELYSKTESAHMRVETMNDREHREGKVFKVHSTNNYFLTTYYEAGMVPGTASNNPTWAANNGPWTIHEEEF